MCLLPLTYSLTHLARTFDEIVYGQAAPLPLSWRMYILIMAGAHINSHYVVEVWKTQFLDSGGDPEWLRGVSNAPTKLQNLLPVLSLLSQAPWLVTAEHIQGLFNADQGEAWSTGEFVHAIALMTTGDMLGKFASGCGIVEDASLGLWQDDKGAGLQTPRGETCGWNQSSSPVIEIPPEIRCCGSLTNGQRLPCQGLTGGLQHGDAVSGGEAQAG